MNCNDIVREHVQTVFGDGPWEPKVSPLLPQLSDEDYNSRRLYLPAKEPTLYGRRSSIVCDESEVFELKYTLLRKNVGRIGIGVLVCHRHYRNCETAMACVSYPLQVLGDYDR